MSSASCFPCHFITSSRMTSCSWSQMYSAVTFAACITEKASSQNSRRVSKDRSAARGDKRFTTPHANAAASRWIMMNKKASMSVKHP